MTTKAYIQKAQKEKKRHEVTIKVSRVYQSGAVKLFIWTNAEQGELGTGCATVLDGLMAGDTTTVVIEEE